MHDEQAHSTHVPNPQRRRFTKGGLAAPVVLATLASKPVLGASYHCTVSGKISGNTSAPHGQDGSCTISGVKSAQQWINTDKAQWPAGAKDGSGNYLLFKNAPAGGGEKFKDRYVRSGTTTSANLRQVLREVVDGPNKPLGREAVAALLNALNLGAPDVFPISASEVVRLFNGVIDGGNVVASPATYPGKQWGAAQVLSYFTCINGGYCPVSIPAV